MRECDTPGDPPGGSSSSPVLHAAGALIKSHCPPFYCCDGGLYTILMNAP